VLDESHAVDDDTDISERTVEFQPVLNEVGDVEGVVEFQPEDICWVLFFAILVSVIDTRVVN
jgi:hypothetical protein